MNTTPCQHAASGCDYPASECRNLCKTLQPGQQVEVQWHRHGWLPGTFVSYRNCELRDAPHLCEVVMQNGFPSQPYYHPACVRPAH